MTVATPPAPAGNQETLTPDQRVALAIETEVRKHTEPLNKSLDAARKQNEEILKEFEAFRSRGATNNGDIHKEDADKFRFSRYLLCVADRVPLEKWGDVRFDDGSTAGFEAECIKHTRDGLANVRTQLGMTDSTGGYLIPPNVGAQLIDRLIAEAVLPQAGVQMPTVTGSPFTLPSVESGTTFYWTSESGASTKSTAAFGNRTWTPKRGTVFTKLSRYLLRQSNPAVEGIVRQIMAQDAALGLDSAGLEGGGTGGEPVGLHPRTTTNVTGVTSTGPGLLTTTQLFNGTGTDGDYITYQYINQMVGLLAENNALRGSRLGVIGNPSAIKWLFQQSAVHYSGQSATTGGGTPIMAPWMNWTQLSSTTGFPWHITTTVAKTRTKGSTSGTASTLYMGDWSQMLMPLWGGMEFRASDVAGDSSGSALTQDQLWIVGNVWTDVNILQKRFVFCPSFKTA